MFKLKQRQGTGTRSSWFKLVMAAIVLALVLFAYPTPYVVYYPGPAESVEPMVSLAHGEEGQEAKQEAGNLMLTTVNMTYPYANLAAFLWASLRPAHTQISEREEVFGSSSNQEYKQRQQFVMKASQSNAIEAAYRELGIPYDLQTDSIRVISVMENMPADGLLQAGDIILSVDGREMETLEDVSQTIAEKQIGDSVLLEVKRDAEVEDVTIVLGNLNRELDGEEPKPGVGIGFGAVQEVVVQEQGDEIEVAAGEIGGPSAGLMFALEIYDQLVPENITKGYRIAGTGTIQPNGEVGVIGGISFKVVGADREQAEIFFAPEDYVPGPDSTRDPVPNATDAKRKAVEIGTDMEVVPIATLQDALEYLEALQPKK